MYKENIALSIKEMQKLESLGLDTSNASILCMRGSERSLFPVDNLGMLGIVTDEDIPTYTLSDILNILPKWITKDNIEYELEMIPFTEDYFEFHYRNMRFDNYLYKCADKDTLHSAYLMLLWCLENNYIKTNKV